MEYLIRTIRYKKPYLFAQFQTILISFDIKFIIISKFEKML